MRENDNKLPAPSIIWRFRCQGDMSERDPASSAKQNHTCNQHDKQYDRTKARGNRETGPNNNTFPGKDKVNVNYIQRRLYDSKTAP